jgi:hypothetical protein
VQEFSTPMRAWRRGQLTAALKAVGFGEIHWHDPNKSGYYQPVISARKT